VTDLIRHLGVLGVFLLMVPESACVPVPSEVTLMFSGFGVAQHWLSLPFAIGAATAGNVVGSLIAYAIGATGIATRLPAGQAIISRSERLLDRYGMQAVFIARLLPLARTFVSLPAGSRRLPLAPFIVLTTVGCALWAALFVVAGMLCGSAWAAVSSVVGKALLAVGALAILAFLLHAPARRYAVDSRSREVEMTDEEKRGPQHPSRSVDAAAARWGEAHPDEDPEHQPPAHVPEEEDIVPNRHSASAEAASLRWHEQHPDSDE
jgi:membrane protein DedA with SNARE-associated domain